MIFIAAGFLTYAPVLVGPGAERGFEGQPEAVMRKDGGAADTYAIKAGQCPGRINGGVGNGQEGIPTVGSELGGHHHSDAEAGFRCVNRAADEAKVYFLFFLLDVGIFQVIHDLIEESAGDCNGGRRIGPVFLLGLKYSWGNKQ